MSCRSETEGSDRVLERPHFIGSVSWAVEWGMCIHVCTGERRGWTQVRAATHGKGKCRSRTVPKTTPSSEADPNQQLSRGWPVIQFPILPCPRFPGAIPALMFAHAYPHTCPYAHPIHKLNQERQGASAAHQRKVVRVNPDNAQVGIIGVVPGNLLQDFQELKTIWNDIWTTATLLQMHRHFLLVGFPASLAPLCTLELFIVLIKMLFPSAFFW